MIEFLTIFLHLMSGIQAVEVAASPQVARVELVLDGATVATLHEPPWRADVDFGPLAYRTLDAVSFDAEGKELRRISQKINLPRPQVEARIVLAEYHDAIPTKGQVVWNAAAGFDPIRIDVRLDDEKLEADDSGSFALPALNLDKPHVILADLRFPRGIATSAEVVVGGRHGSELSTGLTSVPVAFDGAPGRQAAAARIRLDGAAVEVVAVEKLGGHVAIVQDPDTHVALRRLAGMMDGREHGGSLITRLMSEKKIEPRTELASLIHPCADTRTTAAGELVLFPVFGPLALSTKSLAWVASHARFEQQPSDHLKLADAVANAAVRVAASPRPRAVVLVLGHEAADESQYRAQDVQGYLKSLRVPLYVWRTESAPKDSVWPVGETISSGKKLRHAAAAVQDDLGRQWVVWLDGRFTPDQIQLLP